MDKDINNGVASILIKVLLAALLMALAIFISDYTGRHVSQADEPAPATETTG
jgi:hypothetical protein